MKKIILIGAAILVSSGALLYANNSTGTADECCGRVKCTQGVCQPAENCPDPAACCKE